MRSKKLGLLAVDIGNSTVGLGLYRDASIGKDIIVEKIPLNNIRSSAMLSHLISDLFKKSCNFSKPVNQSIGVIMSSVVPELSSSVVEAVKSFCPNPLMITHTLVTGLTLEVSHPEKLGSDRIANALAGFNHFGKPVAVIDFGTATTITAVGKRMNLCGGAILPGINMMREALASKTARLPLISLSKPFTMLGRDTDSAIASGIINGTVGAVNNIIGGIEKEARVKLRLILTGGHARLVSPLLKREHVVITNLIFEGMRLIYNMHG